MAAPTTLRPWWNGALLRADREAAGLSRPALSEKMGNTSQIIKLWENSGETYSPSPASYAKLWRFFGRDPWYYAPVETAERTLTDYRLRMGITIEGLIEQVGLYERKVQAIEAGRHRDLNESVVEAWAELLGISPVAWYQLQPHKEAVMSP